MANSFGSRGTLEVGKRKFEIHRLSALENWGWRPGVLPFSLRILLENLLRHEDGKSVKEADIRALCAWEPKSEPSYGDRLHALDHELGAVAADAVHLGLGSHAWHKNARGFAKLHSGERYGGSVISSGSGYDARGRNLSQ